MGNKRRSDQLAKARKIKATKITTEFEAAERESTKHFAKTT